MLRIIYSICFTAIFLIIYGCDHSKAKAEEDMIVFYFPFELETFSPINEDDIESRAECIILVPNTGQEHSDFFSFLNNMKHGEFDSRVVRLKAKLPYKDIYIDQDGGVKILEGGIDRVGVLSSHYFKGLRAWVERSKKKYGCKKVIGPS